MTAIFDSSMAEIEAEGGATSDAPLKELKLGALVAGAFFVGLLGWAAFTPLDAGAVAQGVVVVSGNRQAVQHREGGIVSVLHVSEGQAVEKGDVLLQIAASELLATERGLTGEVIALQAQRARLLAERDGLLMVTEPAEFGALTGENRVLAEDALRGQRLLFDARRSTMVTERAILSQRIRQHSEQVVGYERQLGANHNQNRLINDELSGLRSLANRGFVAQNHVRAIERNAAQLEGARGALEADIAKSEEAVGEIRLQMVSLDRNLLEEVATQLREAQVRLDDLQPRLGSVREQLARSQVRAPESGRVVGLTAFTVGGVVGAGETIMEIVPQDRALVVKAKASPVDADDLNPGMTTQVRFSSFKERNLPILQGKISKVSADSLQDPRSGESYFEIEVVVPPAELEKATNVREDLALRAGLPAEVMVPLRERTALAYLIEPLTQTLWKAGREH